MAYFAEFVTEKQLKYHKICNLLDCITKMATKMKINDFHAAILLDQVYIGIDYCYRKYKQDENRIIIPFGEKYLIYTEESVEEEDYDQEEQTLAEKSIQNMFLDVTGAREGDIIMGIKPGLSKGVLMKISSGFVPPSKKILDLIRKFPSLWERFINNLSYIPFFNAKSINQRNFWLSDHERDGEYDIVDTPILEDAEDVYLQIFDVGESTFLNMEEDILTTLLSGNEEREDGAWKGSLIRDKFPKKPGSNARRHTLIFFSSFVENSLS